MSAPRTMYDQSDRMDWWAQMYHALHDQLEGDDIVQQAGFAAMLRGRTPQGFAAELAIQLQKALRGKP